MQVAREPLVTRGVRSTKAERATPSPPGANGHGRVGKGAGTRGSTRPSRAYQGCQQGACTADHQRGDTLGTGGAGGQRMPGSLQAPEKKGQSHLQGLRGPEVLGSGEEQEQRGGWLPRQGSTPPGSGSSVGLPRDGVWKTGSAARKAGLPRRQTRAPPETDASSPGSSRAGVEGCHPDESGHPVNLRSGDAGSPMRTPGDGGLWAGGGCVWRRWAGRISVSHGNGPKDAQNL